MGALIVGAMALYLLISIGVVVWAIRYAKSSGKSATRWGLGAALVMYLIPFWDWIPTVAVHQYYCAKESGFWVYKTVDQWKAENPGVMETLTVNKGASPRRQGELADYTDTHFINQRFNLLVKHEGPILFNRWRWEYQIVDAKTEEIMARYLDFSTGNGFISSSEVPIRFWLQSDHCDGGKKYQSGFWQFKINLQGENR